MQRAERGGADQVAPEISSAYPIPPHMVEGVQRTVADIAAPGARWSGAERIDIARIGRAAKAGEQRPDHSVADEVARMAETIASHAHQITQAVVDGFVEAVGKGPEAFVEIVGVVARVAAIDTFMTGIGSALLPFPEPSAEPATGIINARARKRAAFVPMDGPAGATTALSSIAGEDRAQEELHGSLYLRYSEMGDDRIHKGLPRWQLEVIAARTSLINECFY